MYDVGGLRWDDARAGGDWMAGGLAWCEGPSTPGVGFGCGEPTPGPPRLGSLPESLLVMSHSRVAPGRWPSHWVAQSSRVKCSTHRAKLHCVFCLSFGRQAASFRSLLLVVSESQAHQEGEMLLSMRKLTKNS